MSERTGAPLPLAPIPAALRGVGPVGPPARLPPDSMFAWRRARRILAIRLDALGDVLMTTPAFRAIKATSPRAHLALLTSPAGAEAVPLVPEIDEVVVYDAPWMKATTPRSTPAPDLALVERARAGRYDGAIVFTVHSQSPLPAALVAFLAGIPRRLAHCRENPYQLLTDWLPEPEPDEPIRHEVRRQLDLVAAAGFRGPDERLSVRVPAPAARAVRGLLGELGVDVRGRWLVVHPGASAPSRRYPPERFGAVVRRLADLGWTSLLTGTAAEEPLVEAVRATAGGQGVSLAGRLSPSELAALLAIAPLLVSNNSAPVHLAAALGTPVVELYALTNLQHAPWAVPAHILARDVPCAGCRKSVCPLGHHLCLRGVEPDAVVRAVLDLVESGAAPVRAGAAHGRPARRGIAR